MHNAKNILDVWRTKYVENKKPVKHVDLNINWVYRSYINLTKYIKSINVWKK